MTTEQALRRLSILGYTIEDECISKAVDWLNKSRNENGKWDMGAMAKDGVYFPLSDDWRQKGTREFDCTYRVQKLIDEVTS